MSFHQVALINLNHCLNYFWEALLIDYPYFY